MSYIYWLKNELLKLIKYFNINNNSLLLYSISGIGEIYLIKKLIKLLICKDKINILNECNNCINCKLMLKNKYPYLYIINKEKKNIGVDEIRNLIFILKKNIYINEKQIIIFPKCEKLTVQAINSLLKIIEDKLNNTYFFFMSYEPLLLLNTLKSRCLYWYIKPPTEKEGLYFLQIILKKKYNKIKLLTVLRISNLAPIKALNILKTFLWKERLIFLKKILFILKEKKPFLILMNVLKNNINYKMYCFITLLEDIIKFKLKNYKLINLDQILLIHFFSIKFNIKKIYKQIILWFKYKKLILKNNINEKILILNWLINWKYF